MTAVPADGLEPGQLQEAAAAFADVHNWAGSAWRRLSTGVPVPTLASVLADVADMTTRLEQLQDFLRKGEISNGTEEAVTVENSSREQVDALKAVWADLAYLQDHGALAGVAEVICERRRQIEVKGFTVESDDGRFDFAGMASLTLARVNVTRQQGTADIGSDEDGLRKSGALAAAEIDRLNRLVTP